MDDRIGEDEAITAFQNMRGDGDMSPEGYIEIDRTQPLFPVVRFKADRLPKMERGSTVPPSVTTVVGAGCYELVEAEETVSGETVIRKYLANQYYLDGAVAKGTNFSAPLDPLTQYGKFLALRVPMGSSGSPTLETYGTYSALQTASLDPAYVTLPLYQLDANGDIVCDFRNMPRVQAVENLYQPS